jgi:hypothetical protein
MPRTIPRIVCRVEQLEARDQPATLTVDLRQPLRSVNPQMLGTNIAWWDSNLGTAQTKAMVQAAGLTMFRLPGGSSSNEFHFADPPSYNGKGTAASMAKFIASVGGGGIVTLNYGTGDPKEAAAFLSYLNAPTTSTAEIGMGVQWSNATNTWAAKDWKTASYWAGLRAASPLANDDGLNFLRIGRSAPFGFRYFEIGNEIYGTWEVDRHGQGGDTGAPYDPATYIRFAKSFAGLAANIDPTISIGLAVGSISYENNWTSNILSQSASQGFVPGFLSDHTYVQGPGSENDSFLLHAVRGSTQDPANPRDWLLRGNYYRTLINQRLGAAGANVELLATEFNSVYTNPGKQSTSLVNGLFIADSLGRLLESQYSGANVWDLRNGFLTGNNNSASLYGWRQGGDYGLLGSGGASATVSGVNTPYPSYFAEQLVSKIVHAGDIAVATSSNTVDRTIYAIKQASGRLSLLVINKDPVNNFTDQILVSGFQPSGQATVWQYGKTQDTAQSQTTDGHAALANSNVQLALSGANFSFTFPSYSMTVLELMPATTTVLASTDNPTTGGSLVTFTATVSPSPGASGTVTFLDSGVALPGGSNIALVGGVATFQISALSAGTHPISAAYSGAANFAASTSNTINFVVNAPAPQVVSVTPNANIQSLAGPQRSRVASLVITFDRAVQLDTNAFALALHTSNVSYDGISQPDGFGVLPASLNATSGDNITWTVTFSGNTDDGADGFHSLKDGVYDLKIAAANVHPLGTPGVAMASDFTTTFHRLFAATQAATTPAGGAPGVDFTAIVNSGNNLFFRNAFNNPANYRAEFDFNGDGIINTGDNLALRNRFNKALTWRI